MVHALLTGHCCWRFHISLPAGEVPYLHTEPRGEKLPCVLQIVYRCTEEHQGEAWTDRSQRLLGESKCLPLHVQYQPDPP